MALVPKFSIRQLLVLMIAIGAISACLAGAARGNSIAFGLSVSLISIVVVAVVLAFVTWVANLLVWISGGARDSVGHSTPNPEFAAQANVPEPGDVSAEERR